MLPRTQFQILNACADDYELFYSLFAQINYGGQVFPRAAGSGYAQYVEDQKWTVRYSGKDVAADVVELIRLGLLACWRVPEDGEQEREPITNPDPIEFVSYWDYECLTWDDHFNRYGYGPHEFKISAAGLREINETKYDDYVAELGWN